MNYTKQSVDSLVRIFLSVDLQTLLLQFSGKQKKIYNNFLSADSKYLILLIWKKNIFEVLSVYFWEWNC